MVYKHVVWHVIVWSVQLMRARQEASMSREPTKLGLLGKGKKTMNLPFS